MSGIQGMDVAAIRTLAARFGSAGDGLARTASQVESVLVSAPWKGTDATRFRHEWQSAHRPVLQRTAALLRDMGKHLLTEAQQQEKASHGGGAGTSAADPLPFGGAGGAAAKTLGDALDRLLGAGVLAVTDLEKALERLGGDAESVLRWLTGPDRPHSMADVTAHLGWQKAIGDAIDGAMKNPEVAGVVGSLLGFQYVKDGDFYTTNEHSIQSYFGFHKLYDEVGPALGMDLDANVVKFTDPDTGKEYMLELWKGEYGAGGAYGGEIGLYTRDHYASGPLGAFQRLGAGLGDLAHGEVKGASRVALETIPGYYSAADDSDQVRVEQTISTTGGGPSFTSTAEGADGGAGNPTYWDPALRTDPGVHKGDITQSGTIHPSSSGQGDAMYQAMRRQAETHPGFTVSRDDDGIHYTWTGGSMDNSDRHPG